jgi:uncharacterized membrane protein YdjX (TVP38/TMEM64 family)
MTKRSAWTGRVILLLGIGGLIVAFFALGLQHVVSLDTLKAHERDLLAIRDHNPVLAAAAYLAIYIVMAALSVPGALIVTLAGGAIFGLVEGTVLVSFGSTIGATLAFLASRFLFRDLVARRFQSRLDQVNRGLDRGGWLYLLSLRLVPAIPFFLINLIFGVTSFSVGAFYAVSQIGMLPATIVYVNAGTRLGNLQSLSGILSPLVIGSLLLIAVLPITARLITRRFTRPT